MNDVTGDACLRLLWMWLQEYMEYKWKCELLHQHKFTLKPYDWISSH